MGSERPRGGVDYPRTCQEFRAWFGTEADCVDYLARLRWPAGFRCPVCGGDRSWLTAKRSWMCAACGRKTSVTAGTIFHRTHTPLSTWFAAAWFVTSQKNGVSALGLQGALGFGSYETAWAWLHKLRRAMVRPDREMLSGIVEVDEIFIGGRSAGKPGGASDKVTVIVAVERVGADRLGRVRFGIVDRPNTRACLDFVQATVEPGSIIRTDGAAIFGRLTALGYTHEPSIGYRHGYRLATIGDLTPGVHQVASLLKRWIAGTLHHHVSLEQLPYSLDEYTFRFNRRPQNA